MCKAQPASKLPVPAHNTQHPEQETFKVKSRGQKVHHCGVGGGGCPYEFALSGFEINLCFKMLDGHGVVVIRVWELGWGDLGSNFIWLYFTGCNGMNSAS